MKSTHAQMAFDRVDRYVEDGRMKCRKGKECNGRCIPKSHECGGALPGVVERVKWAAKEGAKASGLNRGSLVKAAAGVGVAGAIVGGLKVREVLTKRKAGLERERAETAKVENALKQTQSAINQLEQSPRDRQADRVNKTITTLNENADRRRREGPQNLGRLPTKAKD